MSKNLFDGRLVLAQELSDDCVASLSLEIRAEQKAPARVLPGAIHNALGGQFAAFARDAEENKALFARVGKLRMTVLAIGGDHSYGSSMKAELEFVASDVQGAVITDSGHWIMEEQPQQAIAIITRFIAGK